MGLYKLLFNTALHYPENLAVVCSNERYTYSQLKNRVDALAMGFIDLGVKKNHNIAIISENCHRFLETYFAAAKLGAPLVPINYRLAPNDFLYILNNSRAKVLLAQPQHISWIAKKREDIPGLSKIILMEKNENEPEIGVYLDYEEMISGSNHGEKPESEFEDTQYAQIYYTSGTTGKPKGVVLTHRNNLVHAQGAIQELDLSPQDRWLHVAPMFHLADAWAVWSATQVAATHIMIPCFEPDLTLSTIQEHKVTLSNFIPTMLNILVNHPRVREYDFTSLRLIMSGGAPIAKEVVRKVLDIFGCNFIQTYGLTETSPFLTMSILGEDQKNLPFEERLNIMITTGRPFFTVQLKVVKEDGEEVIPNGKDVGEILVKGETITPGYWEMPKETSQRIVDGWLFTRDLAFVNPLGYVTIVDRKDDMIITGGENVYSIEVEDVLYCHPDILEAAVIGLSDPVWGEKVTAIIVLKEGRNTKEQEIIEFCRDKIARFKAPKKVIFTDSLPKTGSAKIYKYILRKRYNEM
jgi:acyl-CoA synthetase (AMP-forming)/AMP-acid ligase II